MLSCDWGTSTFRLRLVDVQDLNIVGEINSNEGVVDTFTQWERSNETHEISREHFYANRLQRNIEKLSEKVTTDLTDTPIVISGMASSSIGIKEVPYASLPFSLDGKSARVHRLDASNGLSSDAWLISGVQSQYDVMRGEETQIIGLSAIDSTFLTKKNVTCILPGTHSKHIRITEGELVDFQTFMTGELFQLMTRHSILRDSIAEDTKPCMTELDRDAFGHGVEESGRAHLLQTLFSVRTNQLFDHLTKQENFYFLSGLMIGAELRTLSRKGKNKLMLCSGSNIFQLYELALHALGLMDQATLVSPDQMDKVAVAGQVKVFENIAG